MGKLADKEIYQLWWEYLRRSDDYKKLCLWVKARRAGLQGPASPHFRIRENDPYAPDLVPTYLRCGNVHACSFEEWWEWLQYKFTYAKTNGKRSPKVVEDFTTFAGFHLRMFISHFVKQEDREPTLCRDAD